MTSKSFEFYSLALVRLGYVIDVHSGGGGREGALRLLLLVSLWLSNHWSFKEIY
jgi:hypothetical protein